MVEVAPAPAKAATKTRVNKPRTGPSLSDRIVTVVTASNERGGVSGSAIKKALKAGGYDVERNNGRVKLALRNLVLRGTLIQAKGSGINGSFKISKKAVDPKATGGTRKTVKTAKTVKTVKTKKPATPTKKPAAKKPLKKAKKPVAKKTTKGPKKTPRKTTKTARKTTKSPRKGTKSPKKVKTPKKVAKKSPAAKKSPVKRVSKPKTTKAAPKKK